MYNLFLGNQHHLSLETAQNGKIWAKNVGMTVCAMYYLNLTL